MKKTENNQRKKSSGVENPLNTTAGKVVIWVLLGAMIITQVIALFVSLFS